jgi:hypothetical protein
MDNLSRQYFTLSQSDQHIEIESTKLHGAHGSILLHARNAKYIFHDVKSWADKGPISYSEWLHHKYPVSEAILVRRYYDYDDCYYSCYGCSDDCDYCNNFNDWGRLQIEIEGHGSCGFLILGEVSYELAQLNAFLELESQVLDRLQARSLD